MKAIRKILSLVLMVSVISSVSAYGAGSGDAWIEKAAGETLKAEITVFESEIIRPADKFILSAQTQIEVMEDYLVGDTAYDIKQELKDFLKEKGYNFPAIRWGGTPSECTNVMTLIGPVNERKNSIEIETGTNHKRHSKVGPVEFLKFALAINPDIQYMPNVSVTTMTPEDTANYAAFLTHTKDQSEWGALRASYGLSEPIKVFAFEIGNEIDYDSEIGWEFSQRRLDWYIPLYKQHVEAIRKMCPDAKFIACGKTAMPRENWRAWTIGIAEGIGEEYMDYISIHPYYDGYPHAEISRHFDAVEEDLETVFGEGHHVKVAATEHAKWEFDENPLMFDLGSALSTAHFFNLMYKRPRVGITNFHSVFYNGEWSTIHYLDGKYMETMVGKMYNVYDKGVGDRVLKTIVSGENPMTDEGSDDAKFTVLASAEGKRELNLILLNRSDEVDFDLSFNFENNYTLTREITYTAPNLRSYVSDIETENIDRTTDIEKNESNFKSYHMPNKSLVVLKLVSDKDLGVPEEEEGGDSTDEWISEVQSEFTDLEFCWANYEISKLYELGLINGKTETEFDPSAEITRAEFAAMIMRVLGKSEANVNNVFPDVPNGVWYQKNVLSAYVEGIMVGDREGLFKPETPISIEETAVAAVRAYKAENPGHKPIDTDTVLKQFNKSGSISHWARSDLAFAADCGLLYRLYENGNLDAKANTTRAEAAAILYRLYTLINK